MVEYMLKEKRTKPNEDTFVKIKQLSDKTSTTSCNNCSEVHPNLGSISKFNCNESSTGRPYCDEKLLKCDKLDRSLVVEFQLVDQSRQVPDPEEEFSL